MADIYAQVKSFKERGVDIVQITAGKGVDFTKLAPEVKASMVEIAQMAWFAGGEAYL